MNENEPSEDDETGYWNYRVMRRVHVNSNVTSFEYGIVEAFYQTSCGKLPYTWTEEFMRPSRETMEELINDLAWMTEALSLPVLDHNGLECEPAAALTAERSPIS